MPSPSSPADRARVQAGFLRRRAALALSPRGRAVERAVSAGLSLPLLPRRRRVAGSVWAVTMVKDEADILGRTLDHLLAQGVAGVIVSDNGSTDGTLDLVRARVGTGRVHLGLDHEPRYYQAAKMSRLARAAWRAGADWVVPFDADELWFARGATLAEALAEQTADVVHAELHNAFPTADGSWALDRAVGHGKVAFRSHPLARLGQGNHAVSRPGTTRPGATLYVAHLPWRSREQLARKVRQGAAALAGARLETRLGSHWRDLGERSDPALDALWSGVLRGERDPDLHWTPEGELVPVDLAAWHTWDPAGLLHPGSPGDARELPSPGAP